MRSIAAFAAVLCVPAVCFGQDADAMRRVFGQTQPVAIAKGDPQVSAGSIAVSVVDQSEQAAPDTVVRLGTMLQDGKREEQFCTTDAEGKCAFEGLASGTQQSYRVSVKHQGATYASTPFRLDLKIGHSVVVRRLGTTTESAAVLQLLGRTMVEFLDDKVLVSQEATLSNIRGEAYVFPKEGLLIELPEGFTAFDAKKVMTDQRLVADERGLRLHGSIAPGTTKLTWSFQWPFSGDAIELSLPVPFRTVEYHVMSDAIGELQLNVDRFPEAQKHQGRGRDFFVTRLQRRPGDPPLETLKVRLSGIPGNILLPKIALGIALAMLGLGLLWGLRSVDRAPELATARARRRAELLDEAVALQREHDAGDIGPTFFESRRRQIVAELAEILQFEHASGTGN